MKINIQEEKGYVTVEAETEEESYLLSWHLGIQPEGHWTWYVTLTDWERASEQRLVTLVQR